jgi:hypothetical protein
VRSRTQSGAPAMSRSFFKDDPAAGAGEQAEADAKCELVRRDLLRFAVARRAVHEERRRAGCAHTPVRAAGRSDRVEPSIRVLGRIVRRRHGVHVDDRPVLEAVRLAAPEAERRNDHLRRCVEIAPAWPLQESSACGRAADRARAACVAALRGGHAGELAAIVTRDGRGRRAVVHGVAGTRRPLGAALARVPRRRGREQ